MQGLFVFLGISVALLATAVIMAAIIVVWIRKNNCQRSNLPLLPPLRNRRLHDNLVTEASEEVAPPVEKGKTNGMITTGVPSPTGTGGDAILSDRLPQFADTRIVAMARDPYCLFTYWEISSDRSEEIKRHFGSNIWELAQLVLRLYDTSSLYYFDANQIMEVPVTGNAHNWYLHAGLPDHTLFVELGVKLADGRYHSLARSNLIQTPRDRVSDLLDQDWLLLEEQQRQLYERYGQSAEISSAEQLASPFRW